MKDKNNWSLFVLSLLLLIVIIVTISDGIWKELLSIPHPNLIQIQ